MAGLATSMSVIDACGRAGVSALLISDPGVGKSSVVRCLAAAEGVPVETVIGSQREPQDIAGYPVLRDGALVLAPPRYATNLIEAGGGYLFLDELTTCPPSTQAPMLTVALEHVVGDTVLPDSVRVVAGANPPDRAAGGYDLTPPLANRFCHIDFAPTVDEWLEGFVTGFSAPPRSGAVAADDVTRAAERGYVAAFIQCRPELLHRYPTNDADSSGPWPSRRSWTMVAGVLAHLRDDDSDARTVAVCGLIGAAAGAEYLAYRAACDLPAPDAVVNDPSIVDWSDRPDRVWAVLSGVIAWANARGTKDAWIRAWGPVAAAAEVAPDVAGSAARALASARPANATIPKAARAFRSALVAAGMTADVDGAA